MRAMFQCVAPRWERTTRGDRFGVKRSSVVAQLDSQFPESRVPAEAIVTKLRGPSYGG